VFIRFSLFFVFYLTAAGALSAQDPLAEQRVLGLKGVTSVAIVFQPVDELNLVRRDELADMIQASFARDFRNLTMARTSPEETPIWLNLNYVITEGGGFMQLAIYRWVQLDGMDLFAETWHTSRVLIGTPTADGMRETLQALMKNFAADHLKANPAQ
jgi:hypothetical protein